jgi:four helix bundle protein
MANEFFELKMWQKASDLLKDTVNDIESFPKRIGAQRISNQLFDSVSSISANIAEGFGRRSKKEFAHSCTIARGECDESRNWYYQCKNISLLPESIVQKRDIQLLEIRKLLSSFISRIS